MNRLSTLLLLLPFVAIAQNPQPAIDWDRLAQSAVEHTEVNLEGSMLTMAAKFLSQDDPDQAKVRKLLEGITGIYVHSYEFDKPGQYSMAQVEALRSRLRGPEWSEIVQSKNIADGESTHIYMKNAAGGGLRGLMIIDAEPKELTVVNIAGTIDLANLGALSGRLGIPNFKHHSHKSEAE